MRRDLRQNRACHKQESLARKREVTGGMKDQNGNGDQNTFWTAMKPRKPVEGCRSSLSHTKLLRPRKWS